MLRVTQSVTTVGLVAGLKPSPWITADTGAAEHSQHISTDDILVAAQLVEDIGIMFASVSYDFDSYVCTI